MILTPFGDTFWRFCLLLHTLKLNKSNLTSMGCPKYIIKCLYQLVFKFGKFLDSKLNYLLNYWRFCDFDPFRGHVCRFCVLLHNLKLNKSNLTPIVLEMDYKMLVPIIFQVWPIFRVQINVFVKWLLIFWFWSLLGTLFGDFASFCTLWT